jgi:hypothetical protein
MYMKKRGLRGNSRLRPEILSDSIKISYIVASKAEREKNATKNRG